MKNPDRLYELLPTIYRQRDQEQGQPLRALLRVIGEQVDVVEEDIAQLYDNWFIETCDDWVVPYIGDLLGFQLVHEAGQPGDVRTAQGRALEKILIPRREVGRIIAARRRRGTLALLEELARDVAGWPARAVEFYQTLGVTQAINQLQMRRGRRIDVREIESLDLMDGAFNRTGHTVDVRRVISRRDPARANIPSAGLFVWRLRAYRVSNTPASCIEEAGTGENCFTFSVLGHNSPLFNHPRPECGPTHIASELNVPAPIRLRALAKPIFENGRVKRVEASEDYYGDLGGVYRGEKSLAIRAPGWPGANEDGLIPPTAILPVDLRKWDYEPDDDRVAVDPKRGRIVFPAEQAPPEGVWVSYYYGFSADIGGGEYRRPISQQPEAKIYLAAPGELRTRLSEWKNAGPKSAVIELTESEIYDDPVEFEIPAGHSLQIRAAAEKRPIIRLLDHKTNEPDSLDVVLNRGSSLVFDGLLITGRSVQIRAAQLASKHEPPNPQKDGKGGNYQKPHAKMPSAAKTSATEQTKSASVTAQLQSDEVNSDLPSGAADVLGPAEIEVSIRHCTLVPGWTLECDCAPCQPTKGSLHLRNLQGRVNIEHSIVGAVRVSEDEVRAEPIDLRISDSVLDATGPERAALSRPGGAEIAHAVLTIARSTVVGEIHSHVMRLAENCIFTGHICVARRQIGCVRFCYVVPGSRTPRRYECQPDLAERVALDQLEKFVKLKNLPNPSPDDNARAIARARGRVRPQFNSTRYGSPVYCQLTLGCPEEITRGAEDESEMGVFHDLFQPQRTSNLRARLDEFTPAGMETGIIYVT
jgi:hypothetical protein